MEAVKTMARIAEAAEKAVDYRSKLAVMDVPTNEDTTTAISYATCTMAMDLKAAAIITVTLSGFTAEKVAKYKPTCQIIGCAVNPVVSRQMNLLWAVKPMLMKQEIEADELFEDAVQAAKEKGYIKEGDLVVITAGMPLGIPGTTNMIRVIEVK